MPEPLPTLHDVYLARQRTAGIAARTPLVDSPWLSEKTGKTVRLKLENLQPVGSFKLRGAANKLLALGEERRARGVITVSTGNHGRAVAYVARQLGVKATIVISEAVPEVKLRRMRALGAELVVGGATYDEATARALALAEEAGLTMVHPFDDPYTIAGQGTIGLEIAEDWPQVDTAVVPLSGGGLLGGIALALKSIHPSVRTVGVTMDHGAAMYESLKAGEVVEIVETPTLADALAGGIGPVNRWSFEVTRRYVDETVLVSEEEIAAGMTFALQEHGLVVEGGGAVGLAALLYERIPELGENIAVVVSGGNVDLDVLLAVAARRYPFQQGQNTLQ